MSDFIAAQADFNVGLIRQDRHFAWPSEILIMLLKGSYIPGLERNWRGQRALDIGCGHGNNMLLLHTLGLDVHGLEVAEDAVQGTRDLMAQRGVPCTLAVGTNRSIPYPDGFFDLLVSWSVIHYENSDAETAAALDEYARVLKPGGRLLLQTAATDHFIWENAQPVAGNMWRVGCAHDYRQGKLLYRFSDAGHLRAFLERQLTAVHIGRCTDDLFTKKFDLFIATGIRPQA